MYKGLLLFMSLLGTALSIHSQCFKIIDGNGLASSNPYFINCAPGTYTVIIQANQALGSYTIDWGDGSANSTGTSLVSPNFESHTYSSTTDTFNISISSGSCSVDGVVVMERNPLASIQLPSGDDNFGCTPVAFRYINSSTQVSQTTDFVWDYGDGSQVENYDHTNLGDTLTHTYQPGIGVESCDLEVTLTATNYCGSSTASFFPVKVWDLDEADITPSATLLCYPDTIVSYKNTTIRNCYPEGNQSQRYEYWNFGDYWGKGYDSIIQWRPWNPPIINPPPIAYPGTGTYTVTLLDSSFCGINDVSISITITDPPIAAISSNKDSICAGETVRFFSNSSGGANIYSWNFDQGAGWQNLSGGTKNRSFNTPGNYVIRLAVGISGAQGCFDTASVNLVVNPGPITDFSLSPSEACDSLTTVITNLTSGTASIYEWDFGNGQTSTQSNPPDQIYNSPGNYIIKLYAESNSGCMDSTVENVNVRQSPVADFSVSSVCVGQQAVFTDLSTFITDSIQSWKWYFGDGDSSSQQNPLHAYNGFGNFEVVLLVESDYCWDSDTMQITVEAPPTADFTMDTNQSCSPLKLNFTNNSSLNASSFIWNFGDSSLSQTGRNVSHIYTNLSEKDTTYIVRLIAFTTFGCADTTYDTVKVFANPKPSFTSNASLDCGPVSVDFTNTTSGSGLSYLWDFGDSTTQVNDTNPTHIFENKTLFISNYNVKLIAVSSNGCSDTVTDIVTVYPEPIFSFTSSPDSGCSPLQVNFPSVVGAVSYSWDFGDGNSASGPTPSHTFVNNTTNDQNFQVRLIAKSSFGCVDTSYGNVLVHPNPTAAFVIDTNKGCQPLPISITNNSTGAIDYSWNFGDGSFSDTAAAAFVKTYENHTQNSNFHKIQLIVESDRSCKDTANMNIEVHPFIQAKFNSDTVGCSPLKIRFNNASLGASNYQWQFGDGSNSTSTNPQHVYTNTTNANETYRAALYAVSPQGCQDSSFKNILIYPKPEASYSTNLNSGCQPLSIVFTNSSIIADSCSWIFGDGSSISGCNPSYSHTYTNTTSFFPLDRKAELRVFSQNGCSDTMISNIQVKPEVKADFSSDSIGCSPLKINFQNLSTGGNTYEWRFGDGGGQASSNAIHTFFNSGYKDTIFSTELIVTSSYNCKDTLVRKILVHPKPLADFSVDVNSGCQPLAVNFSNNSILADSCRWNFGDASFVSDCSSNIKHTYSNTLSLVPVNYKAELVVYSDQACSDSLVENINVSPLVEAEFIADTVGCSPLYNQLRSQSFGAVDYFWDFGDGHSGIGMLSNHTFSNTGSIDSIYKVQLIASSIYNCNDTVYKDVLVRPTPIPEFTANPLSQTFPNSTVSLINESNAGNWDFDWDFDDSSYSKLRDPGSHQYDSWGKYFIQLKASTDYCADSIEKMIEIKIPLPIADFRDTASGCAPLEVSFENLSKYAIAYEWDFGDGGTSTLEKPVYTYYRAGEYTVSLKAIGYQSGMEDVVEKHFYIKVFKTPTAGFFLSKEKVFIPNDPLVLSNTSRDADNYFWDFGDGQQSEKKSPVHYYTAKGEYFISLIASSKNGCIDTFKMDIPVLAEGLGSVVVPNAFTPNPHSSNGGQVNRSAGMDVMNDVFYAKIQGAIKYELNIFNKWGELLFVSKDVNIGWDGYYKGELCQQDAYVWKIKAEFVDGTSYTKVGDLLLLR